MKNQTGLWRIDESRSTSGLPLNAGLFVWVEASAYLHCDTVRNRVYVEAWQTEVHSSKILTAC